MQQSSEAAEGECHTQILHTQITVPCSTRLFLDSVNQAWQSSHLKMNDPILGHKWAYHLGNITNNIKMLHRLTKVQNFSLSLYRQYHNIETWMVQRSEVLAKHTL